MNFPFIALATALLFVVSGCRKEDPAPPRPSPHAAAQPAQPQAKQRVPEAERIDLLTELSRCEVEHHGRLLDFGGTQPPARGFSAAQAEPPPSIDRGGDTFERVFSRETLLDF